MSEMMKVEAEEPGGLSSVSSIPAPPTSELEQKQDNKDLIHQVLVVKEEVPHDWSPSLDQLETEPPHIKDEEEEQRITLEEEHRTVKIEDEEKPQLSELHHLKSEDNRKTQARTSSSAEELKTEYDVEDCEGPEPDRNPDPVSLSHQTKMIVKKGGKKSKLCSKRTSKIGVKTEEKPFGCTVCDKRFKCKDSVKLHMVVHTGKGEHSCDLCGKTFRVKCYLQTHMRVHNGEKPFACDVCSKRFYAKAYLKLHMKLHSTENPFSCDICGTRFKIKER
uniref:Zinc finger protein OZF-like n=1 Tax=Fundulus heteroclitus TaxID=8078 RepID=A0A3Q2QQY8_FUNHE